MSDAFRIPQIPFCMRLSLRPAEKRVEVRQNNCVRIYTFDGLNVLRCISIVQGTDVVLSEVCGCISSPAALEIYICVRCACAVKTCLLYTSPSPRDRQKSRMPSS